MQALYFWKESNMGKLICFVVLAAMYYFEWWTMRDHDEKWMDWAKRSEKK